jgi:hypothetical protein
MPSKSIPVAPASNTYWGLFSTAPCVLAVVLFVITRFFIYQVLQPRASDVADPYFQYAARAVDLHETPYTADFEVEYPPLAWWAIVGVRLLDDRRISNPQNTAETVPVFLRYSHVFRFLMFACDLGSFLLLARIVSRRRAMLTGWALLLYTISTALLGHLLYDRLDAGLLLLLMGWAYCYTRSLGRSGRRIGWGVAAFFLIGVSISFKLIPVIGVPFLVLAEVCAFPRWPRLAATSLALALGVGVPFGVQCAFSGPGVFSPFTYHAERGIQIESLYSTLMMIASGLGYSIHVSHTHGAFQLSGDLEPAMKWLSSLLLLGFLAGVGAWGVWQRSRYRKQDAYRLVCYVIPAAVILSNVFSPQYLIWALPLIILLGVEVSTERSMVPWILFLLLIVVAASSTWIFPYHYYQDRTGPNSLFSRDPAKIDSFSPVACTVLGLRNITYVGIVVWLGIPVLTRRVWGRHPKIPPRDGAFAAARDADGQPNIAGDAPGVV